MRTIVVFLVFCLSGLALAAADTGAQVVVVFNTRVAESKQVADHYARLRQVPSAQVIGLNLPQGETMTRAEYREQLEKPLLKELESRGIFSSKPEITPATQGRAGSVEWKLLTSIRYVVLCYGVPLRIAKDSNVVEEVALGMPVPLRRNEAAVDTELALLPLHNKNLPLTGPLNNPFYGATNAALLHPTNGILMVARIDGPTAAIARGLVDKAMEAETNGLWGRAYFDLRGITEGAYKDGDVILRMAADATRRIGYDTIVDEAPETFPAAFPMSHVAFYGGWYDTHVSGPFARPKVEFMPGAIAYHLHSFSAQTIRSADTHWVGPLLAAGATATLGCVDEPYLSGTPDIGAMFARFILLGFSFGEAAYAGQPFLSWQTTVVGDPLYRPFRLRPQDQHAQLEKQKSPLLEWSHLRVVNLNLVGGYPAAEVVTYLEELQLTRRSAVLMEKLGDLYQQVGKPLSSIDAYRRALKLEPSPQQRVRLTFALADRLRENQKQEEAYALLQEFLRDSKDYPDRPGVVRQLIPLAQELKKPELEQLQREIAR
jgi:uncharacterized protein (TIGR03790 family)